MFRRSQQKEEGLDLIYLQDLHGQMLATFDHIDTLTMEVERVKHMLQENNKLLREVLALGWKQYGTGVPQAEERDAGPINGKDHQGASQGQVRVPMVGGHGVEALS